MVLIQNDGGAARKGDGYFDVNPDITPALPLSFTGRYWFIAD
jgi:hypothetical protein